MSNQYPHHPKTEYFTEFKGLEGVQYGLVAEEKVKDLVFEIFKEEFDSEDFQIYGDLENLNWLLEEIDINKIKTRDDLMNDPEFIKSLNLRTVRHTDIIDQKISIPPLILRGSDLLVLDGYARLHAFKKKGIKKVLAYVGR